MATVPSKKRATSEKPAGFPAGIDLKEIFKAPDEFAADSDINNPWNFRSWWNTIQAQDLSDYLSRSRLYYKALQYLPGSYKLWYNFLKETRKHAKQFPLDDPRYSIANDLHEKSLVFMSKMPMIWLKYAKFLIKQKLITSTRRTFDNSLKALPATQHDIIWKPYVDWAKSLDCFEVAKHVVERYIKYNPDAREEYIDFLMDYEEYNQAALEYIKIIDDDEYVSPRGTTKHDIWMSLCRIISKHPDEIPSIDCEAVIRHAIKLYTDEVGNLWVALAEYYIRQGYFEKARNIFEEAIEAISTTRDFGIIFNAYSKLEEQIANTALQNLEQEEAEPNEEKMLERQIDRLVDITLDRITDKELGNGVPEDTDALEADPDYIMYRLETLLQRRPFLLSHVVLRQNPNNVYEWLNLAKLCEFDDFLALKTYTEAVLQIDPQSAYGKLSKLWVRFAEFYEERDDLANVNQVFHKATSVNYKTLDELSTVWCAWAEMHIRHHNYESARAILKEACSRRVSREKTGEKVLSPALSHAVWAFYADVETAMGSFQNVRGIYQKMLDTQLATPQTVLNYGAFLENSGYYEESFRVYEKAINSFQWPHVYDIWVVYLAKFTERYGGSKLERLRDLFEQVVKVCPPEKLKFFYYMYADVEENFGLYNRAIDIYDRALRQVSKDEMIEVLKIAIAKTAKFFGLSKTRKIYQKAFEILEPKEVLELGLKYAKMEKKLGEIDRARAIYMHLSQYCNPKIPELQERFWKVWEQFEVMHGSEETFKDFLKIQRSVAVKYAIQETT